PRVRALLELVTGGYSIGAHDFPVCGLRGRERVVERRGTGGHIRLPAATPQIAQNREQREPHGEHIRNLVTGVASVERAHARFSHSSSERERSERECDVAARARAAGGGIPRLVTAAHGGGKALAEVV